MDVMAGWLKDWGMTEEREGVGGVQTSTGAPGTMNLERQERAAEV